MKEKFQHLPLCLSKDARRIIWPSLSPTLIRTRDNLLPHRLTALEGQDFPCKQNPRRNRKRAVQLRRRQKDSVRSLQGACPFTVFFLLLGQRSKPCLSSALFSAGNTSLSSLQSCHLQRPLVPSPWPLSRLVWPCKGCCGMHLR